MAGKPPENDYFSKVMKISQTMVGNRLSRIGILFFGSFILYACAGSPGFLVERSRSEALALRELCRARPEIKEPEIVKADSLLEASDKMFKASDLVNARLASEVSIGYYRIALARAAKLKSDKEWEASDSALAKDKDRLGTYREILAEMKARKKP